MPKGVKFIMRTTATGFELVEGRWPSREGQLWRGQLTDGSKVEVAFSHGDIVAYNGWSN